MVQLNVNGKNVEAREDMRLIDFLRDEQHCFSVKEGCSEGACGTCAIIVDGKKRTSCRLPVSKVQGAKIITVEGLSEREKEVYSFTFGEAGAVQCGFCIPGMVISAKVLIDANPNPTREDVKKAIRGNICRCTGYVKIIDAIMNAAKIFREDLPVVQTDQSANISTNFPRVSHNEKVLGTGKYVDDVQMQGMVYASAIRSEYPRAKVLSIDLTEALKHPDCLKILRAEDVPFNKTGHIIPDWDVLIAEGDCTRYEGDAIVLVASKNKQSLDDIKSLVKIEYEVLEPITCPTDAMKSSAPLLHANGNVLSRERLVLGNVREAQMKAEHVVTRKYYTPFQDHAFMEPEAAIAFVEDDILHLYTASQSVYDEQREISRMLQIEPEKVRAHAMLIGGGFGGKEDMSVQHHAALMAYVLKKPVKVKFTRDESFRVHVKKHPFDIEMTTGCDKDGKLLFTKATIISDTGAYASLGGPVLQRACTHAAGPYNYQNIDILGVACYTNNPPAGAFRGFGVSQSAFAIENNLNLLAKKVGISPWEIRKRNIVRPGDVLPNAQIVDSSCALEACLDAVKEEFESSPYSGIACAFKNSGIGVGLPDIGRCILSVENGKIHLRTSAADIGQGSQTITLQMICETTGISADKIVVEAPDTFRTPNAGTTTASRQTAFTGEAVRVAAEKLREELKSKTLDELEGKEFFGEFSGITDPMGSQKENPKSHVTYSYGVQVAIVDEDAKLKKMIAAYDIGRVINPKLAEGQVEGGIAMGIGYALSEKFKIEKGHIGFKYATLGLPRSTDVPEIKVTFHESDELLDIAYGAKGVGEISMIPTAPAIALAYERLDGEFRNVLPVKNTPYQK